MVWGCSAMLRMTFKFTRKASECSLLNVKVLSEFLVCFPYVVELHTYLLRSRVLFEKLTGSQLVEKFPSFYGTPRFITAFISARHLSLSWARWIQSMPPHLTSWRSILILSLYLSLGLPSDLVPSGFPTKTLYASLLSPTLATYSAYPTVFVWSPKQYWVRSADHSVLPSVHLLISLLSHSP